MSLKPGLALGGALLIAGAGIGGYAIGSGDAASTEEADAARAEAFASERDVAEHHAFQESQRTGEEKGAAEGQATGRADGLLAGRREGNGRAREELAELEAAEAASAANAFPPPGTTYSDQLPHGEPGYVLPPEARSLSCVGFDADTGECIGD